MIGLELQLLFRQKLSPLDVQLTKVSTTHVGQLRIKCDTCMDTPLHQIADHLKLSRICLYMSGQSAHKLSEGETAI